MDAWDQDHRFNYDWILDVMMKAIRRKELPLKITLIVPGTGTETGSTSIHFTITGGGWMARIQEFKFHGQYVEPDEML